MEQKPRNFVVFKRHTSHCSLRRSLRASSLSVSTPQTMAIQMACTVGIINTLPPQNCVPSVSLPTPSLSMAFQLNFMLLPLWFAFAYAVQPVSTNISLDSTLYPTVNPTSWLSPSGHFAFGFYPEGSAYSVGVWLVSTPGNTTVIWTALRDNPLFPKSVSLKLTNQGLKLLNTPSGDRLISNDNSTAAYASMLDTGNFVIHNSNYKILWQTFDHPTDTIMPGQTLTQEATLFSSISATNHSIGNSRLVMQADGNLVMYPVDTYNDSADAYYATGTNNKDFTTCSLNLDTNGRLYVLGNNGTFNLTNGAQGTSSTSETYLARLDSDGIFRLYSYDFTEQAAPTVLNLFPNPTDQCQVKVACGFNSYCTSDDGQLECLCLPGFDYADPQDKSNGCTRNSTLSACPSKPGENVTMIGLQNMVWLEDPYAIPSFINSTTGCIDACRKDCFCDASIFDSGTCMKLKFPMTYGRRDKGALTSVYIKVVTGGRPAQAPASVVFRPTMTRKVVSTKVLTVSGVILGLVIVIAVLCVLLCQYRHTRTQKSSTVEEILAFPRWFSYKEITEATCGFKEILGKGSFGTVFKGALTLTGGEQIAVAVKRLEKVVEEGEREFRAEMKAIGRTHHKNLVRLLGFCEEGSNRLLIYELMNNGSLAGIIFNPVVAERPHWSERVRIILDVARGINYLHEDCETCIIHCDIKPQNILMDGNWTAKISDFGLAKLLMPSQTRTFTQMRGTRGYLAPEWAKNAPISVKADVYSFGIVLLETLCCRKNMELAAQSDEIMLLDWVYNCFIGGELEKLVPVEEDIDEGELERMVKVGLWCIQNEPSLRPYMKNVVMMLEGNIRVPIPPSPASVP